MNKTTFFIVRHGESEINVLDKKTKAFKPSLEKSSPLTAKGIDQAKNLAKEFKNINFDAIFSSDYARAKETAEILKMERKLAIETTEAIRERQFGAWEGKWHLIKHKLHEDLKKVSESKKMGFVFEDVETEEHVSQRFLTFLREIAVGFEGKRILVVCHGNLMRTLLWKLGWAKYHELPSGSVENTAYYVIESDGTDFDVKEVHGIEKKSIN